MRIFDIVIVIITTILIISFIIITLYFKNNNNMGEINNIKNSIEQINKEMRDHKDDFNFLRAKFNNFNFKLGNGSIIIFTTKKSDNNDIKKILDVQIIKIKVFGNYLSNDYASLSTLPFEYQPKYTGEDILYHIYGVDIEKEKSYYIAPLDNENKNIGTIIIDGKINYLKSFNKETKGEFKAQDIDYYKDIIDENTKDKIMNFDYISSFILTDGNEPLQLENKKYLMTLKNVYSVYPGVLYDEKNKK